MKLKGVDFKTVWGASGAQGFFGEGYWYHRPLRPFGLDFNGATFVAKTTTFKHRVGNMDLNPDFTPRELFPKCIVVKPLKGVALNAVGLCGPGARELFETGRWQKRRTPFFISFMSVAKTRHERMNELIRFLSMFSQYYRGFKTEIGLQINKSCPNVGLHVDELVEEVDSELQAASYVGIPLVMKFNVLLPIKAAVHIASNKNCDALCISNTIPWGQLPNRIDWKGLFGSGVSPLAHLGGGGLSGKPLLPLLLEWLDAARKAGVTKPINACGGILSLRDAQSAMRLGAGSVSLGSIAFLKPWRIRNIIRTLQK